MSRRLPLPAGRGEWVVVTTWMPAACCLAFDQLNQQMLAGRMNAPVDLLEHIEAGAVRSQQRS